MTRLGLFPCISSPFRCRAESNHARAKKSKVEIENRACRMCLPSEAQGSGVQPPPSSPAVCLLSTCLHSPGDWLARETPILCFPQALVLLDKAAGARSWVVIAGTTGWLGQSLVCSFLCTLLSQHVAHLRSHSLLPCCGFFEDCAGPFLPSLLPSSLPFLSSLGPSKGLAHHRCSIDVYRECMSPEQKTDDIFYVKFTVPQKPCGLNDQKEKALGTIYCLFRHGVSTQFGSPDSQIVVAPGPYVYLVPCSVASSFTAALARAFCKKTSSR